MKHVSTSRQSASRMPYVLLVLMLLILWTAGGSSREDVIGQTIVRVSCWLLLITLLIAGRSPSFHRIKDVTLILGSSILLVALQLVPVPPAIWTTLPGRELFSQSPLAAGHALPWRPLSLSPGATLNSLSSLIVPLLTLVLLSFFKERHHKALLSLILGLITASSLLGLIQFSGGQFNNPFINDIAGSVSASFANRNHFALFLAIGCLIAPAWACGGRHQKWKLPLAMGLILLFSLSILATGSRAGVVLGLLGVSIGMVITRSQLAAYVRHLPKLFVGFAAGVFAILLLSAVWLSFALDRAISLNRILSLDVSEDLRRKALPVVWNMVESYFPFGTGFGTFDPAYRIHEPFELLGLKYFNHAHNDFLEVVLEGGLGALILLVIAIVFWMKNSWIVWKSRREINLLPMLGSTILLLVFCASIIDYPARTPMIMSIIVIAAVWLVQKPSRQLERE